MARQLTEAEVARRTQFQAQAAASRAAFQDKLLEAQVERAASAETVEVLTPQAFVAKLVAQGGPLARNAEKGGQDGEEADHGG